jgi:hypothetical protein
MDKTQLTAVFLSSAAIGALVSAGITALSQWRERKSRREEVLLEKAIGLADWRFEIAKHNAITAGQSVEMSDKIIAAEGYFKLLKYLLRHGELPAEFKRNDTIPKA